MNTCLWTYSQDGHYDTACGYTPCFDCDFEELRPAYAYCPHCGKKIETTYPKPEPDDE
jgi:hypothetical protein